MFNLKTLLYQISGLTTLDGL